MRNRIFAISAIAFGLLVMLGCEKETVECKASPGIIQMGTISNDMLEIPLTEDKGQDYSLFLGQIPMPADELPLEIRFGISRDIYTREGHSKRRFVSSLFPADERMEVLANEAIFRRGICRTTSPDGISWTRTQYYNIDEGDPCNAGQFYDEFEYSSAKLLDPGTYINGFEPFQFVRSLHFFEFTQIADTLEEGPTMKIVSSDYAFGVGKGEGPLFLAFRVRKEIGQYRYGYLEMEVLPSGNARAISAAIQR